MLGGLRGGGGGFQRQIGPSRKHAGNIKVFRDAARPDAGSAGGHAHRRQRSQQSVFHPGLSVPVGTRGKRGRENIFHASLQASPGNKRTRSQRATGAGGTHGDVLFFTLPRLASSRADTSCCSYGGGGGCHGIHPHTHRNSFPRYLKECRVICMEIIRCAVEAQLGYCAYCEHQYILHAALS